MKKKSQIGRVASFKNALIYDTVRAILQVTYSIPNIRGERLTIEEEVKMRVQVIKGILALK
jgi:hypothetical protein